MTSNVKGLVNYCEICFKIFERGLFNLVSGEIKIITNFFSLQICKLTILVYLSMLLYTKLFKLSEWVNLFFIFKQWRLVTTFSSGGTVSTHRPCDPTSTHSILYDWGAKNLQFFKNWFFFWKLNIDYSISTKESYTLYTKF